MTAPAAPPERYGAVAIALHWAIGAAVIVQIAFGFALDELAPRGTPVRAGAVNLHKSIGIVLGVLIVARVVWRWRHRPPAWPAAFPALRARLASLDHRALYACMIAVPLSGYLASNFSRHGIRFFGIVLAPWGPDDRTAYAMLNGAHVVLAALLTVLVVGHVAIAIAHARRDGGASLSRMWPRRPPPAHAA